MDADANSTRPPIIVRRKRKRKAEEHHGGAWKVAYADFVTAMMAFFLLLWLLNTTTTEQRQGIADYFDAVGASEYQGGARSVLGGETIVQAGSSDSGAAPAVIPLVVAPTPPGTTDTDLPATQSGETAPPRNTGEAAAGENSSVSPGPAPGEEDAKSLAPAPRRPGGEASAISQIPLGEASDAALAEETARREARNFNAVAADIRKAIAAAPELAALGDQVLVEATPKGLRVQLVDDEKRSMFASGSANPLPLTRSLLAAVARAIDKLPNRIVIAGHTDGTPFRRRDGFGNWELSAERANASRRALVSAGISEKRIFQVSGKADTEPLLPEDPRNPANRRISILLMHEVEAAPAGNP